MNSGWQLTQNDNIQYQILLKCSCDLILSIKLVILFFLSIRIGHIYKNNTKNFNH